MVTITKKEAAKLGLRWSKICEFHEHNPDQTSELETCDDCQIIQEPCGCDSDMCCESCAQEYMNEEPVISKAQHLAFTLNSKKPKTNIYSVFSDFDKTKLGKIYWYGGWRQYVFEPVRSQTIWSEDCLKDLAAFLEQIKEERKNKKRETVEK